MTSNKMDEELRNAALRGDVEYLQKCVESNKPIHYYLSFFPFEEDRSEKFHCGNIFHMAAMENQEEFIREAMLILPQEAKQRLLVQPRGPNKWNPLHIAAKVGNIEIVNMFLDVYRCLPTLPPDLSERPWLQKNQQGNNPCLVAVIVYQEECALEIYKMDTELISNMTSGRGSSLVYEAILMKMSKLALEILRSPHPISCAGYDVIGYTPFHEIHNIEGSEGSKEIFRQLLQREPELIKQKFKIGNSSFQAWALNGKIWPFKILLECNDIIQDVNKVFTDLVSSTNTYGRNSLHSLARYAPCEEDTKKIAKLLIEIYKKKSPSISNNQHPWLVKDNFGDSPLSLAIEDKKENLALYLLSVDDNVVIESKKNVLFLAIENECCIAAEEILKIIDNKGWNQLLANEQKLNVLHLAPLCTKNFCSQLIEGHPELIKGVDKEGSTILHSWIKSDKEWLFNFILESKWNVLFVKLIDAKDYNYQNNPFHVAATATTHDEATNQIVRLLVQACQKHRVSWDISPVEILPWFEKNKENEGPLHLALHNKHDDLALYILSLLREDQTVEELLDYYEPEHSILFLAVENNCPKVTQAILKKLDTGSRVKYLKNTSDGRNILHLATSLQEEKFGTFLVNEAPELVTEKDNNGQTPWDAAYDIGCTWFIKTVLKRDKSVFNRAPLAWIKACEKGHVLALRAFICHNPGAFRDLCINHKDSPLHHIKLSSLTEYEELLKIRHMKDLINLQNSQGETPLHKAIRKGDILLTETLLNMDKIAYDLKDKQNVTAMELLAHKYEDNEEAWGLMCKRNGLDPKIKTAYFRHKTNLIDVRNSLFVVAALLATITFTAGFTIPGGFNQETGEALLGEKACFLVFLVSDALALFSSMLVLISLTWSMVFEHSKSIILIDRSMVLLRISLNCTLLAFMTGVYIVIAAKSLWVAILIIVIISSLIIISINKDVLYYIMDKLFPAANKECKDPMQLVEMDLMCKRNEIDPRIKTTYFQHKTNLLDVRTSLFVVAALLATITFTAGFTLPGGFNQESGEALLGKKASFIVFLISDTFALFFSMLVLVCLTWSMVFEPSESLILVDRSMVLLRVSLNCTLLAFMTGVYIVMAPKSLWVAIIIIVIISLLIIISIDKRFLYKIMDKWFPAASRECKDPLRLIELGYKTREEMDLMRTQSRRDSIQSDSASNHSNLLSSIYHKIWDFRFRFKRE